MDWLIGVWQQTEGIRFCLLVYVFTVRLLHCVLNATYMIFGSSTYIFSFIF